MRLKSIFNGFSACCFGLAALLAQPVGACGYHGSVNNPFTFSYPGSIQLAVNTRQALDEKVLKSLLPVPGGFGLKRSVGWLERLARQVGEQQLGDTRFHILVMNSGLWTSVTVQSGVVEVTTHVDRPENPEIVILVSEEVLSALVGSKLDATTAVNHELVLIDGDDSEQMLKALVKAYPAEPIQNVGSVPHTSDSLSLVSN